MSKKRAIRQRHSRVLLSDVLPYELPPSFNNRGLYDFVNAADAQFEQDGFYSRNVDATTATWLSILLGKRVDFAATQRGDRVRVIKSDGAKSPSIPFQFTVRHRANAHRTLTIPHPGAQLDVVHFYSRFDELMLYHTSKGEFSLRRPARIARYSVVRDWLFESRRDDHSYIEDDRREYEWLRSYFTYKRYSNVYKFYDSKDYRSCERRFGFLVKADVAKCFDSIYTHSIAWAAHGHSLVKQNLKILRGTFGEEFDRLMQRMNHNETSGITIGSEVSRIFAEVILQAVDVEVRNSLEDRGLRHGVDYEILRYVDDYFIFLADAQRRLMVLDELALSLRKYKLHLNSAKEEGEYTPWLSPLTVAKMSAARLVKRNVKLNQPESEDKLPRPFVRGEQLITGYKAILIDSGVSHFDLANFTLSRTERATEKLIKDSMKALSRREEVSVSEWLGNARSSTSAILALLDFAFFAYSGAPRMSPAVKLARIASSALRFSRVPNMPAHDRERLELRLRDELISQLKRASRSESPSAVTATLIDCLTDLGEPYAPPEPELAALCGFEGSATGYEVPREMNALLFISLLLNMRDSSEYRRLRSACIEWAIDVQQRPLNDAERAIVSLNLLSCEFVGREDKARVLAAYEIRNPQEIDAIVHSKTRWNVDWSGFDLYAALQRKRLFEVY